MLPYLIAGNHVRGVAAHSQFQKFVILRVAAGSDFRRDLNPLCLAGKRRKEATHVIFIHVLPKSLPAEDFVQFSHNRKGQQELPAGYGSIEGAAGNGIGKEESADQDVGIEDEAQATRPSEGTRVAPA